jgi:hypothetical protein
VFDVFSCTGANSETLCSRQQNLMRMDAIREIRIGRKEDYILLVAVRTEQSSESNFTSVTCFRGAELN